MSIFIKTGLWLEKKLGFKGEFNLTKYIQELIVETPVVAPYKTYVAYLTQNDVATTSGLLIVGKVYRISSMLGADNFSNVGWVNDVSQFIATGTTPTVWASGTSVFNLTDSAPVATIIYSDLGATVNYVRSSSPTELGSYTANFAGFNNTKVVVFIGGSYKASSTIPNGTILATSTGFGTSIYIDTFNNANVRVAGMLLNTSIEIRLYN